MSTGQLEQLLLGIADAQVAAMPGVGRIVLSGPAAQVLADDAVRKAYLGI